MFILIRLVLILVLFAGFVREMFAQTDSLFWSSIKSEIENTGIFRNSFHGLVVYEVETQKCLLNINGDKYFTPASNVKIPTLYAGLTYLKDSLQALRYVEKGDSLIIWGTGDPTFLNANFFNYNVYDFLKKTQKKIFLSLGNYDDKHFGAGWAWDDYMSKFVPEKSPFPIYGNMATFITEKDCNFRAVPKIFEQYAFECEFPVVNDQIKKSQLKVNRELDGNLFNYYIANKKSEGIVRLPFRASPQFIAKLLADTLKKDVEIIGMPLPAKTTYIYSVSKLNMLRRMMQQSDNFLAEQTLLLVGDLVLRKPETESVIDFIQRKHFNFANPPKWVDGSGLSRYNLFTPNNFVEILMKIWRETKLPKKDLLELFAIGGKAGTLASRYQKLPTFLYAKTGTLSNNHSLSGFLITKSGKTLCFSFQNNHYLTSLSAIGDKMEDILTKIYLEY
jgi:D-alanyl-D-alanine carboxypeptidase/D-alanyl-D-alanine-endopeptidase (penicillin-binding protein 4)